MVPSRQFLAFLAFCFRSLPWNFRQHSHSSCWPFKCDPRHPCVALSGHAGPTLPTRDSLSCRRRLLCDASPNLDLTPTHLQPTSLVRALLHSQANSSILLSLGIFLVNATTFSVPLLADDCRSPSLVPVSHSRLSLQPKGRSTEPARSRPFDHHRSSTTCR